MKASDFRIGNYVYSGIGSNEVIEVYPMFIVQFFKIQSEEHNIKPIPLTEEWLLRLGFRIAKTNTNLFINGSVFLKKNSKGLKFNYKNSIIYINHVHQLQNLYFALTNQELTLNNK